MAWLTNALCQHTQRAHSTDMARARTSVGNFISDVSCVFNAYSLQHARYAKSYKTAAATATSKMHFAIKCLLGCTVRIYQYKHQLFDHRWTCFSFHADTIRMPLANVDLATTNHPTHKHTPVQNWSHIANRSSQFNFNPSCSYVTRCAFNAMCVSLGAVCMLNKLSVVSCK